MTVVAVTASNSTKKKVIYNSNQRVNAKTVGAVSGLEDDIALFPKSLALLFRAMFGILFSDKQFFNGNVASFSTSQIVTKEGAYLDGDNIYFLEALTLTPTPAGYWGFYEIELEAVDSDPASLQFFDVALNQVSQQTVNTRKSYNIKVYENYNNTASFPTLTPGRIKWIEYKKDAAFGDIIEVNKLLNSVILPKDKSGTVALLEDQTFLGLLDVPDSYAGKKGHFPIVNPSENGIAYQPWPGMLNGGLAFNNTAAPPIVRSGFYGVSGAIIQKTSDTTLATTDTLDQSRQSLDTFCQYLVLMNSSGSIKYLLYGESQVATGNITSITGSGTTKTINFATGSLTGGTSKILVITGNNGVNGIFKIASNPTSSSATFESVSALTGGASGTWTVFERISTLHGTGSNTAITVDADVLKYSPSYGENGFATGIVAFDHTKNGFYCNIAGYTDYRVIGNFRTNGSSQVVTDIISHKSGRKKNDNSWHVFSSSGLGSTNTTVLRFSSIAKIFGSDYILVPNNSSLGASCTFKQGGSVRSYAAGANTVTAFEIGLTVNSTQLTSTIIGQSGAVIASSIGHNANSYMTGCAGGRSVSAEDILRPQASVSADYSPGQSCWGGEFVLD